MSTMISQTTETSDLNDNKYQTTGRKRLLLVSYHFPRWRSRRATSGEIC